MITEITLSYAPPGVSPCFARYALASCSPAKFAQVRRVMFSVLQVNGGCDVRKGIA